jgi:hypothetical protein
LHDADNAIICDITNPGQIAGAFVNMWQAWRRNELATHNLDVTGNSRRRRAIDLASYLRGKFQRT